jgi:hypothetical protein
MTIGRVMDWIEARLDAVKSTEEEEEEKAAGGPKPREVWFFFVLRPFLILADGIDHFASRHIGRRS